MANIHEISKRAKPSRVVKLLPEKLLPEPTMEEPLSHDLWEMRPREMDRRVGGGYMDAAGRIWIHLDDDVFLDNCGPLWLQKIRTPKSRPRRKSTSRGKVRAR